MTKFLISYSGGLGSAASVLYAHKWKLDYEVIFADTLIEDDDLYRFNDDIERAIGKPIIKLTDGRTPWDVFEDVGYIGNHMLAHCSKYLKTEIVRKYIIKNYGYGAKGCRLMLGMNYGELDRIERAQSNWNPIEVWSILCIAKASNDDIKKIIAEYNIKTPRLYDYGFPHNNCGGFCVKAGQKQFATLLEVFPSRYKKHEERMELAMENIGPKGSGKGFLRVTIKGERRHVTMKEFRELYQAGKLNIDPYDFGGCACFVDE